jgi:hypothetical protein
LESKNKKHLAALPRRAARPFGKLSFARTLNYWDVLDPRISIGLAVVGIAASRLQGCGIREVPVTT